MINFFDLSRKHTIIDVNRNKYVIPTLHPNRKMSMHDFIYMLDGEWKIGQDGEEYHVKKGDVLIARRHCGIMRRQWLVDQKHLNWHPALW